MNFLKLWLNLDYDSWKREPSLLTRLHALIQKGKTAAAAGASSTSPNPHGVFDPLENILKNYESQEKKDTEANGGTAGGGTTAPGASLSSSTPPPSSSSSGHRTPTHVRGKSLSGLPGVSGAAGASSLLNYEPLEIARQISVLDYQFLSYECTP